MKSNKKISSTCYCLFLKLPVGIRIIPLFLVGFVCNLFGQQPGSSQETTISLNMENVTVEQVLNYLEEKSDVHLLYNSTLIDVDRKVSIKAENKNLDTILGMLFASTNVGYEITGRQVVLFRKDMTTQGQQTLGEKKTISGTVKDEEGEPMIGVSIVEKGTGNGALTDMSGTFSLSVSDKSVLTVTYIGYQTKDVRVGAKSFFEIILEEDNKLLDEVVVVGYGTQKRGNLTGAISSIKSDEIMTTTHSSLAQSLQGKVAGLQIRQQAGEPGEFNTNINVRGFGAPLYVIDGIARDGASEFQRLDPNDIESISILKDASAAIYGFNAGNGVILVTTKKGFKGAPKFVYNGSVGFQSPTNVPKMANAAQLQEMLADANANMGLPPSITKEELEKWKQGAPGYESTDWYDLVMKKHALQTQHNISVSGGNEAVDYFVSFGYYNEEGLVKSNDINYERYTVRSNLSAKLSKYLTADVLLSGRYDTRKNPGEFYWIFKAAQMSLPTESPYANGNPDYLAKTTFDNPLALMNRDVVGYNDSKNKSFQSSWGLTYDAPFLPGLQLKGTAAYDSNNSLAKNLVKPYNLYTYDEATGEYKAEQQNTPARISNSNTDYDRMVLQAQASYKALFNDVHNVGVTLVYEQTKTNMRYSWLQRRYDFYTNDQINQAGKDNQETDGYEEETGNRSYVGRFNYDFAGKYLLEFAFRYDGSYRYHPDNRWDFFPVVSGGWRISEENFMKDNLTWLDNLKFRASYGKVGENAGNPFQYIAGYTVGGNTGYEFSDGSYTSGISSPAIINRDLTWFTATIADIGLDASFFKNRLNIEFDVYQRDRKGLLSRRNVSLPNTFGAELPEENLNTDRVRGIEFMVNHQNKIGDFSYGISVNFNFARTMNRYVEESEFGSSYERWRYMQSNRWSDVLWGYEIEGQFLNYEDIYNSALHETGNYGNNRQLPGSFKFKDINGDGVIDGKDEVPLFWGGQPKLHYGININAAYKGFDLNALLQGSAKYTVRFQEVYRSMLAFNANTPAYFYDRWHLSDPYDLNSEWIPGAWPSIRTSNNGAGMYRESAAFRRDASYLRLKSVEIGYTLPADLVKKFYIENLRIYANGHNLFTFADSFVKAFDPEKIEGAYSAGFNYPLTKSFNFGVTLTF